MNKQKTVIRKIHTAVKAYKHGGIPEILRVFLSKLNGSDGGGLDNIVDRYGFVAFGNRESRLPNPGKTSHIKLAWFIPDFDIGSGGHNTIFRMIHNLQKFDVKSDIFICGSTQWGSPENAAKIINNHFFKLDSDVKVIGGKTDMDLSGDYHLAVATFWKTVYYVRYFNSCCDKAYFVQDFEPYFYPHGTDYLLAENTYKMGLHGITAGDWLVKKMAEYNMDSQSFSFAYDRRAECSSIKKNGDIKKLFFYSRPSTARRCFELGIMCLNELHTKRNDFVVYFAGGDLSSYHIEFDHVDSGVVSVDELFDLYSQCDLSLVLSFTNLSLMPLEIIASGCPVVVNKGENNEWLDSDQKLFIYAENTVEDIVTKMDDVMSKKITVDESYVKTFFDNCSWEKESEKVFKRITNILG